MVLESPVGARLNEYPQGLTNQFASGAQIFSNDLHQLYHYLDDDYFLPETYHALYDSLIVSLLLPSANLAALNPAILLPASHLQLWHDSSLTLPTRAYLSTYLHAPSFCPQLARARALLKH